MNQKYLTFLFPGQGSQYVGMGRNLLQKRDFLAPVFKKADEVLGFPLSNLAFNGPAEVLNKTVNAQPALLMVSAAYLELMRFQSLLPAFVAGHSLGEYSALMAANTLSYEDALRIVRKRGELMEAAYPEGRGGMSAILGLELERVKTVCREASVLGTVTVANFNCPGQIVISGNKLAVDQAAVLAKEAGAKRVVPLNVSGPFHSPLMANAAAAFAKELDKYEFRDPQIRFYTNVEARELTSGRQIKAALIKQLTSCVLWDIQIRKMIGDGASVFYEVGPGKVLSGLMKRIDRNADIKNVGGEE